MIRLLSPLTSKNPLAFKPISPLRSFHVKSGTIQTTYHGELVKSLCRSPKSTIKDAWDHISSPDRTNEERFDMLRSFVKNAPYKESCTLEWMKDLERKSIQLDIEPSPLLIQDMILSLAQHGDPRDALKFLKEKESTMELETVVYTLLIEILSSKHAPEEVKEIVASLKSRPLDFRSKAYISIAKFYLEENELQKIDELLEEVEEPQYILGYMIAALGKNGRYSECLQYIERFYSSGLKLIPPLASSILGFCLSRKDMEAAMKILNKCIEDGVPLSVDYTGPLSALISKSGNIRHLQVVLRYISQFDVSPPPKSIYAIVGCCNRFKFPQLAEELLNRTIERKIELDSTAFMHYAGYLARQKDLARLEKLQEEIFPPSNPIPFWFLGSLFQSVLYTQNEAKLVLEIWKKVKGRGVRPNEINFQVLLSTLARNRLAFKIPQVYEEMMERGAKLNSRVLVLAATYANAERDEVFLATLRHDQQLFNVEIDEKDRQFMKKLKFR